jgi:hypothetical protein
MSALRLLVAAAYMCLSTCAGSLAQPASADSEGGDQQTSQLVAQGETCAKFKELKVGMTASQVLSACGQRPHRTSAMITTGGKKLVIWSYGNSQLHLENDKLVQIFGP